MMMMTNSENINSALETWRDVRTELSHTEQNAHLDETTLVRIAADGGLHEASKSELEHLDNCPLCLAAWASWRRAFSVVYECEEEKEIEEDLFKDGAYGFLEAAATTSPKAQGLVVESSCGSYRLEVLPDRESPEKGMIVLSSLVKSDDNKVTVRDKKGLEILSGTFENGRLARLCRNLDELDLSVWTVSLK